MLLILLWAGPCNCRCSLADTLVTEVGAAMLSASHSSRLQQLRLDGCCMSMSTVATMIWRQPGSVCLWDAQQRGHLPRWVNIASTLLWVAHAGEYGLRLQHAPEPSWRHLACVLLGLAGTVLAFALLWVFPLGMELAIRGLIWWSLGSRLPFSIPAYLFQCLNVCMSAWLFATAAWLNFKAGGLPPSGMFRVLPHSLLLELLVSVSRVLENFVPPPPVQLPPWAA